MSLELTASCVRGVVMPAWRDTVVRTFEVPWSPADPSGAIPALRAELPAPDGISVAIGLAFLHITRVELPPSTDEVRDAMVQLEPERFFPLTRLLRAAVMPGSDVAFAADATWLDAVCVALETWGPIARIEAGPVALLATVAPGASATWRLPAGEGETGVLVLRDGRMVSLRRMSSREAPEAPEVPDGDGVPGPWRVARGAARREDASLAGTLFTAAQRVVAARRGRRAMATAIVAAVAGLTVLFASVDRSRERTLQALEAEAVRLTGEAREALDARARTVLAQQETRLVRATQAERANPAAALAAIGATLPNDVVLLTARARGTEWQIDGTARNAATLVPLLDADPRFDNVRSLAASSRFRDGERTRESFSIAFRVHPTP
ncbi:MAG: hypothetical protein IT361_03625 [Gemmatimonadaceae bacterium]|nr:hypothetical protein [Gemmatimonadaceae bacterium]